jgi:hypothetical protein
MNKRTVAGNVAILAILGILFVVMARDRGPSGAAQFLLVFGGIGLVVGCMGLGIRWMADRSERKALAARHVGAHAQDNSASYGSLRITRVAAVVDEYRSYLVLVDGEVVGAIRNASDETIRLPLGRHSLTTKIDWCESRPVEIQVTANGDVTCRVEPRARGARLWLAVWYALFAPRDYLQVEALRS